MIKQGKLYVCVSVIMICLISTIFSGCAKKDDSQEESIEQVQDDSAASVDEAEIEKGPTTCEKIESNFLNSGITDFEQVDLSDVADNGVAVEDYPTYHFFYESDGLQIEAYATFPADLLESGDKLPCLIYNHGGNQDYGALSQTDTLYYANSLNMIVLASNYRGCGNSQGTDEYGGADVDDVVRLIDLCAGFDFIDPSQIDVLGGSRGGLMTYELLRCDDRIHKAVIIAGIADLTMEYNERSDMQSMLNELVGGTPAEVPETYEQRSATAWADELDTPLLIFHTTGDDKVSVDQARKLVEELEDAGKEYQYVEIDADGHGALRSEDLTTILDFLGD